MYREHTVGVVVPAYNEEDHIGEVIRTMPDYVDKIYVIDDCSTDTTWQVVHDTARESEVDDDDQRAGDVDDDVGSVPTPKPGSGISAGPDEEKSIRTDGKGEMESDANGDQPDSEREKAVEDGREARTDGGTLLTDRAVVHEQVGRVVPIQHVENLGAGGAIKTGYLAALEDKMDVTVTMDGDGQMDPQYMPRLLDPIVQDDADYAKGNRLLYREYRSDMPRFRFLGNSILTFLTKVSSGYWKTMDPQNGYTAISYYALDNVGIDGMYEYYGYCNDLLVKLNAKGMRVADVAIPAIYGDEESSIRYPTYIRKVSWMLLRNFFWRLKVKYLVLDFHPLAFLYLVGAGASLFGFAAGIWTLYAWQVLGESLFVRASISMLVFLIGSLFLIHAMLFDMQVNEDRETQVRVD